MPDDKSVELTQRYVFLDRALSKKREDARIVVLGGPLAGERYCLGTELIFGRGTQANVQVDDSLMSRKHARFFRHDSGSYVVEDLQSRNGTQVNGIPVSRQVLGYGDRVQIGSCLLLFAHHDPIKEQLEHRQKIESIGRLGTGIAHDFNNLMAAVYSSLDSLNHFRCDTRLDDIEVRAVLDDIAKSAKGVNEMTARLLGFAREIESELAKIDLCELCRHVVELASCTFARNIKVESSIEGCLEVLGDRKQLHQLLMQLLLNAHDAMPNGGTMSVTVKASTISELGGLPLNPIVEHALVTVKDAGVGMSAQTCERVFDPFFTTKDKAGAGLGLATVYAIVQAHKGQVAVSSVPSEGSMFQVALPIDDKRMIKAPVPSAPRRFSDKQFLILLVDDDDVVRRSAGRVVRQSGHRVILASNGKEGIEMYLRTLPRPDLVLMDLNMPTMTGAQAFGELRQHDPQAPVLFVSGYWDSAQERELRKDGALGFLQKPYDAETLRCVIRDAIGSQRL